MKHSISSHLRHRSDSVKSTPQQSSENWTTGSWFGIGNRSSTDEAMEPAGDDTTVVEPDQGNVLSHIISQLRPGADLSRVTLPTFILEERSMLERITNFMAHPENLLKIPNIDDPLQRFVAVVGYYLSGWHIKPPGVKKPLNPILGEVFTGYWDYPDKTRGYYISEQTSHHPPKSSYFFMAPDHHVRVDGTLKPRSKFLGNSAASLMEGISYLRFTNRGKSPGGEKYILTQPNMYARGILFGKMKYELGDHSYIRCPDNGYSCDLEFKTKGWVGGTYNAIGGIVKNDKTGEQIYELGGLWTGEMTIKDLKTGQKKVLFDATNAKHSPPQARPLEEQGDRESQKLWREVCKAVHVMDHEKATVEKSKIEDRQREEAKQREESGEQWQPKLFKPVDPAAGEDDLEWVLNADIDSKADPATITKQILAIAPIIPGQKAASLTAPHTTQSGSLSPGPTKTSTSRSPTPNSILATGTNNLNTGKLIDIDSRPSSTAPPEAASSTTHNANLTSTSKPGNLMDDHGIDNKMAAMKLQEPVTPKPIVRTDTETSELDTFVDAEP